MSNWKPAEPELWEQARRAIESDGDVGRRFLIFMDAWLDRIETLMATGTFPLSQALRFALTEVEARLGIIDVWFLGEVMAAIGLYWEHRDDFSRALSPIELKVAGNALEHKLSAASPEQVRIAGETMATALAEGIDAARPVVIEPPMPRHVSRETSDESFAYTLPPQHLVDAVTAATPNEPPDRIWWSHGHRWVYPGESQYAALERGEEPLNEESEIFAAAARAGVSVADYLGPDAKDQVPEFEFDEDDELGAASHRLAQE